MKKLPKIGQRVVVKDTYVYNDVYDLPISNIIGQTGEVVHVVHVDDSDSDDSEDTETYNVLVKFDNIFSTSLHNGRYRSSKEDCWWVSHRVIKKLPKSK